MLGGKPSVILTYIYVFFLTQTHSDLVLLQILGCPHPKKSKISGGFQTGFCETLQASETVLFHFATNTVALGRREMLRRWVPYIFSLNFSHRSFAYVLLFGGLPQLTRFTFIAQGHFGDFPDLPPNS